MKLSSKKGTSTKRPVTERPVTGLIIFIGNKLHCHKCTKQHSYPDSPPLSPQLPSADTHTEPDNAQLPAVRGWSLPLEGGFQQAWIFGIMPLYKRWSRELTMER
jgi:hypothetical protein